MTILVERVFNSPSYCISHVYVDGQYVCDAIEDTDRMLDQSQTVEYIKAHKIYKETAIPKGTYEIKLTYSPKFAQRNFAKKYGGKLPEIIGVPCWSGVRLHPANYATELEGCIAPGLNKIKGCVVESTKCFYKIMDDYIMPSIKRNEKINITIF